MEIGDIILFVKDMKKVTSFYSDVLNLQPDADQPFPAKKFFRFNTGACKLCLHSASKPNGGRQKIVFHVDSVKAKHDELRDKNFRLRELANEGGLACFGIKDPEGNKIQFWGNY